MNPFDIDGFVASAGVVGLAILMFLETGVLVGFVFPGDSLLFTAGIFAAQPRPFAPLWLLCLVVPIAAALGDQVGYALGRFAGPRMLQSRVLRWIGPKPIARTQRYFERYGPATIVFARFIGVVRTVAPLLAGLSRMSYVAYTVCSVIGCFAWGTGCVLAGYLLGGIPLVRDNFHLLILASLCTLLIPATLGVVARRRTRREEAGLVDTKPVDAKPVDAGEA